MPQSRQCPALVISAPASHQGKTAVTAGLARHFTRQGKRVTVLKTGPDFLDPTIHERASGNPVYQLDLWMSGQAWCRQRVWRAARVSDVILIEGVMGLHDGAPSTAYLARLLGIPVALVIDCSGMAQSVHAVAHGLSTYEPPDDSHLPPLRCVGFIANNVASQRHQEMISESDADALPLLACLRRNPDLRLPSRHLGLMPACEVAEIDRLLDGLADQVADTALGHLPQVVEFPYVHQAGEQAFLQGMRIAIACDAAFSFIYRDNVEWLEEMGAQVCYFSPLSDAGLPPADAIYLPGGYPELHAFALSENRAMHACLQDFSLRGGSIYAECGGMLYLLESLVCLDGAQHKMVGLIRGAANMRSRLQALGYQSMDLAPGQVRGHTFHYSHLQAPWSNLRRFVKHPSGQPGEPIYRSGNIFASYTHLWFRSCSAAAAGFFTCRQAETNRQGCLTP